MFRRILFTCVLLTLSTTAAVFATNVSGTFNTNQHWTTAGNPWVVTGSVTIESPATLTIDAGVTVAFNVNTASLVINGKIVAQGSSGNPITFTSNSATPAKGDWQDIQLVGGNNSSSILSYVTISYGGRTNSRSLYISSASPHIDNLTLLNSYSDGIRISWASPSFDHILVDNCTGDGMMITGASSTPTVNNNSTFSNNSAGGINIQGNGGINLTNSTFQSNTVYAMTTEANTRLNLLTGLSFSGNGKDGIRHTGGTIGINEVWHSGATWFLTNALTINATWSLTVDPGVTVKCNAASDLEITVSGRLIANGSAENPITFTTAANPPNSGRWGNIQFGSGSSASILRYVTFSYGGANRGYTLYLNSTPTIDHLTVSNSASNGIRVDNVSPTLNAITVSNCAADGLLVTGSLATPVVTAYSSITANTSYGIEFQNGGGINITNSTINNNTQYAMLTTVNSRISGLTGMTISGNGGGTKDGIKYPAGTISTNERWRSGMVWFVTETIDVDSTHSLTIDAGATVKCSSGVEIQIMGAIIAAGTAVSPIVITTAAATPAAGGWKDLRLQTNNAQNVMTYVTVSYAGGSSASAGLILSSFSQTLDHVTVSHSATAGLYVSGTSSATVSNSAFQSNSGYGVQELAPSSVTITDSTVSDNTNYAFYTEANANLNGMTGLTVTGNGNNQKNAILHNGGSISGIQRWRSVLPWIVLPGLNVNHGATLTIDPGAVVKFAPSTRLSVSGKLYAAGTLAAPILFTCSSASPGPACWTGIEFLTGSDPTSILSYATVTNAGDGYRNANIYIYAASPIIDHVTISNSGSSGIYTTQNGAPVIHNCTFVGNLVAGMTNGSPSTPVDGRFNYWNSATGPSGSGPGTGQSVSSGVNFEPWLIAAGSTPQFVSSFSQTNPLCDPTVGVNCELNFGTILPGSWTLKILNSGGTALRTTTGSGDTGSLSWDGTNDVGVLLPNGTYNYQIESITANNDTATPARGRVSLNTNISITISNPTVLPAFFSPNADTVQDTTTISSSANFDSVGWTLQIKNSSNTVVRNATGAGRNFSFIWDGRNDGSAIQGDDVYTFVLTGTAGSSNQTKTATVVLDNTPPTTLIVAPADGAITSNIYQNGSTQVIVRITALDSHFYNWILDRRPDNNPSGWIWLGSQPTSGTNIYATDYDSSLVANGTYILRLRTSDLAGNGAATQITIDNGNFSMSNNVPEVNAAYGQSVTLTSQVPFTVDETIVIKDAQGTTVRTIPFTNRPVGTYPDTWNCTNEAGSPVVDGPYLYGASVSGGSGGGGGSGGAMTWDETGKPLSNDYWEFLDIALNNPIDSYNNKPLTFTYTNQQAGRVTVKFSQAYPVAGGLNACDPPNYCPKDLVYESSGTHTFSWAGIDGAGAVRPDLLWVGANSERGSFSKNAVICYGHRSEITNIQASPPMFDPLSGTQSIEADLSTDQTVNVRIAIKNQASQSVLRTLTVNNVSAGHFSTTWDGRADNDMLVSPGLYLITLSATDTIGNTSDIQLLTTIRY